MPFNAEKLPQDVNTNTYGFMGIDNAMSGQYTPTRIKKPLTEAVIMSVHLGIDVGSLTVKLAGVADKDSWKHIDKLVSGKKGYNWTSYHLSGNRMFVIDAVKVEGKPREVCRDLISKVTNDLPEGSVKGVTLTGSGSKFVGMHLGLKNITEFKAIAEHFRNLYPEVNSVFEIGGENSKYLGLRDGLITDYETNGDCAAGTGSFLDQQSSRLMYNIEDVGSIALNTERNAVIAGRCSVFAKSDMIHAQQKGYTPAEILKGLCNAIAMNFKGNLLKGKDFSTPVAFIGGVALNQAVAASIKEIFNLTGDDFIIPEYPEYTEAFGTAIFESSRTTSNTLDMRAAGSIKDIFPTYRPLDMSQVVLLRNDVPKYEFPKGKEKIDSYLGIDIGSVSTNLVVIDDQGRVVKEIYIMTSGRPIEVVTNGLREIEKELGSKLNIKGVGTTGSGRELIGELIGADVIKDEITAHKTGSSFISKKYFNEDVDTIFEIGGQDSKFISLEKGVVVDFHMNEACSAGTGSFLQEQAEKLGVQIKGEFSQRALESKAPINLGERCTVFIEKDLNNYQQKGAALSDLIGGLSYSVVHNYLNRVVRGRHLGKIIYFQGGTAYNDSVAAAFSKVLNKRIIVPPHNGVMGAVGMALVAKENHERTGLPTSFRGYDIKNINYSLREFSCKSCSNQCDIQEFSVEGNKTYWGDKCSDKFRKAVKTGLKPVVKDLFKEREDLLFDAFNRYHSGDDPNKKTIGFPRAMYFFDRLPFWATFWGELGFKMVISDPTNKHITKQGLESVIAEPCFPIKVAHGHVLNLMEKNPDYIFMPAMITSECNSDDTDRSKVVGRKQTYFCLWGQTLPAVICGNAKFKSYENKFLTPKVELREGDDFVVDDLHNYLKTKFSWVKHKDVEKAYFKAKGELTRFRSSLYELYLEATLQIERAGREGVVIVGRPYNVNDKGINLNLATKLRDLYGINVLPLDIIEMLSDNIDDINTNMFWAYGRRILGTLKQIRMNKRLHVIYVTNFQCGPDSYIKHFAPTALGKSYLTLQFDGHGNDAGMLTRCEAYLDSKGVFRHETVKVAAEPAATKPRTTSTKTKKKPAKTTTERSVEL
jgi:predicted CoA-substrate-specific enzyme activase